MKKVLSFAAKDERAFASMLMEKSEAEQKRDIAAKKRLSKQKQARIEELDRLFERIYEDNVCGKLSNERFAQMSTKYEQEQKDLRAEKTDIEAVISGQESKLGNVDAFLSLVRKYTDIQKLSPSITNEFIDRIIVHEAEKARGNRIQKVDIIYNGVGLVELPQLEATGA
jgi:hypothetical protein